MAWHSRSGVGHIEEARAVWCLAVLAAGAVDHTCGAARHYCGQTLPCAAAQNQDGTHSFQTPAPLMLEMLRPCCKASFRLPPAHTMIPSKMRC